MGLLTTCVGYGIARRARGWALPGALLLAALVGLAAPASAPAQEQKELVAVLDFDVVGATKEQGAVLTNQLRAELLKTGRFVMVNRAQLDKVLEEQALQQAVCTEPKCAVDVGKILGVRKIVTGSVTKVTDTLWQVSATLTDVATAQVLRQEVVNHAGDFASLFLSGMATVAAKLSATQEEVMAGAQRLAPESIAPIVHDVIRGADASALVMSYDSQRLYWGKGSQVKTWQILSRAAQGKPIDVPKGDVTALATNRKGDRLAVGTSRGYVSLVALPDGRILNTVDAHSGAVTTLAFSPADNFFASGGEDEDVQVYLVPTGEKAYTLEGARDEMRTVRFTPDGRFLLAASADRTVRVYDVNLQKEVRSFQESAKRLVRAALSPDGAYLGIAAKSIDIDLLRNRRRDTELVKIRAVKTGEELTSFRAQDKDITDLDFFPDPRYLATGGADRRVKIWDLQAKSAIANLSLQGRLRALDVSPNGKWLAAADDSGAITIWQVTR